MALLAIGAWADTDTSHPPIPELSHTVGVIDDIDLAGSTIDVNGQTFLITEETRICDEDAEEPLTLEDLVLGTPVKVTFIPVGEHLVALRVCVVEPEPCEKSQLRGLIESIDPVARTFVVLGATVQITPDTRIQTQGGDPDSEEAPETLVVGSFEDLAVGVYVIAKGEWTGELMLAQTVHTKRHVGDDMVAGTIMALDLGLGGGIIDGVTVAICGSDEIEIVDQLGRPFPAEDLVVGMWAAAFGTWNGEILCLDRLQVIDAFDDLHPRRTDIWGIAESVDPVAKTFVVHGITITTEEDTRFALRGRGPGSFEDIVDGVPVHVHGLWMDDGTVRASLVVILPERIPPTHPIVVHGTIEEIDLGESTLVVDEQLFQVVDETHIHGPASPELTLEDLSVGDYVHVLGRPVSGEPPIAQDIHLIPAAHPPVPHQVVFSGAVWDILDESTLIVRGIVVHVTDETEILSYQNVPIPLGLLHIGDPVRVRGFRAPSTDPSTDRRPERVRDVIATEIRRDIALINDAQYPTQTMWVHGLPVFVPLETEVTLPDGASGEVTDLTIGQTVRLVASPEVITPLQASPEPLIVAESIDIRTPLVLTSFGPSDEAVTLQFIGGDAVITLGREVAGGGFVYTAGSASVAPPGTIACLSMLISSDQASPENVPAFRVRASTRGFHRTSHVQTLPVGSQTITATTTPKVYQAYLMPPPGGAVGPDWLDHIYVSFDCFDFDIQPGEPPVTFTIHAMGLEILPADAIEVVEVLGQWDFEDSTDGWMTNTGASAIFSQPAASAGDGALELAAVDDNTYGMWGIVVDDLDVAPGSTLRMRAYLTGHAPNTGLLPTVRMRAHDRAFEQIAELVLQPNGPHPSLPDADGQVVDLIWTWPRCAPPLHALVLNFDLYNLSPLACIGHRVRLESVSLEVIDLGD